MNKLLAATLGCASALITVSVSAQAPVVETTQEQRYGFNAIQRADLGAAEARLIAQRAEEPNEPSVLLNLAYVYAKTGRADLAMSLYDQVLRLPDVEMALASGKPASAHLLARTGKARTTDFVSR